MTDQPGAWRILTIAIVATVAAAALGARDAQPAGLAVAAAFTWALAYTATARFRFLTLRRRWRWGLLLAAGVIPLLAVRGSEAGLVLGIVAVVFFSGRRQMSYELVTPRQRALALGVGLLAVPLLLVRMPTTGGPDLARRVMWVAWTGVLAFWLDSLWTLLITMRLHFLRLRPKLAIGAVLLGVVPPILLITFGLLLLYGTLGGSRANRGADVMESWRQQVAAGGDLRGLADAEWFRWSEGAPTADAPDWAPGFLQYLRTTVGDSTLAAVVDTTTYTVIDGEVFLLRSVVPGDGPARVSGLPVDRRLLDRLARTIRADVILLNMSRTGEDDEEPVAEAGETAERPGGGGDSRSIRISLGDRGAEPTPDAPLGRYREPDPDAGFWSRPLYFGAAVMPVLTYSPMFDRYGERSILLTVKSSLADIGGEFFAGGENFNIAIMVAMGLVALALLFIEALALGFTLRITGGITGAVKELHRGTRRLAAGDLSTAIEVENQDEFGDLADSFNEMTAAVKQGREEALQRQRLQQEMETAREIQSRLLPESPPQLAGFEITGKSIPSRQVGGDYFDFLTQPDGSLGVAIGDVSGKGVPAALLMANLQASLQGQVIHPAGPAEVVHRINDLLVRSTDAHMFASFFYGVLDTRRGVFTCANAGHNPPLLVRADGSVTWLEQGGLLLGMLPDRQYEQLAVQFEPGDVLVLYTDGITEAEAPAAPPASGDPDDADPGDMFDEAGLERVVRAHAHDSALQIREAILAAVQNHLAGAPAGDDITLVVIKRSDTLPGGEIPADVTVDSS